MKAHAVAQPGFFKVGGGGAEEREGREIFENSCIKVAFFFLHIICNCSVEVG